MHLQCVVARLIVAGKREFFYSRTVFLGCLRYWCSAASPTLPDLAHNLQGEAFQVWLHFTNSIR